MNKERVYKLRFASVYPLYIKKVETKGRTKEELDTVIFWLTGYDKKHCNNKSTGAVILKPFLPRHHK